MGTKTGRILNNQAIGVSPLLLSMILDLYISHIASFFIGILSTLVLLAVFHLFVKKDIYQFLLLPTLATYICYSFFLFFDIGASLDIYSPLIAEVLLVSILGFTGFFKRGMLLRVRDLQHPHQVLFRVTLTEAFFVAEILQTLYTLYLFVLLLYTHLPEASFRGDGFVRIFYHYTGALIGVCVIFYEEIRLYLMHRKLKNEIWLPILNTKGHVVGKVPYPEGMRLGKKHCHPVVRVAVVHKGMLYLNKREAEAIVSPELLDHPFHRHVLFRHSKEETVNDSIGKLGENASCKPRFMIRYTFRNNKVNQLVHLYAISLHTEEQLHCLTGGKLWTIRQIEANLHANIFSEYFCREFSYLKSTILLAESV
ncbi:MAG: hypothetical protein LBS88_10090 [Tannerellaceae bacterium]|jgi:hypothetical protein|nr:hypothetical protein [Tannerellaceae bacterium]